MADNEDNDVLIETGDTDDVQKDDKKGVSQSLIIKIAAGLVLVAIAVAVYFFVIRGDDNAKSDVDETQAPATSTTDASDAQEISVLSGETDNETHDSIADKTAQPDDTLQSEEEIEEVIRTPGVKAGETEEPVKIDLPALPEDASTHEAQTVVQGDNAENQDAEVTPDKVETETDTALGDILQRTPSAAQSESASAQVESTPSENVVATKPAPVIKLDPNRYIHIEDEFEDRGYPWTRPRKTVPPPEPKWGQFDRLHQ